MAQTRSRGRRPSIDIWPGFVDALAQLLMVIIFILLVFTVGQFYLSDALNGRDEALKQLQQRISQLADELALEKQTSESLRGNSASLTAELRAAQDERDALNAKLSAAGAAAGALSDQTKDLQTKLAAEQQTSQAAKTQVEQVARYRSEFFGKLSEILGNRPDIRVVGDRFVFQAEVLFAPGKAELAPAAKQQLDPVFAALKEISAKIPPDIDWVLQINGHTDHRPIHNADFASNWELSTARAISVVRYAIDQGIPANHLSAAGFADNQPIDAGDGDDSYKRNRRIELKLTER